MKLGNQTYILLIFMLVFCINMINAVNMPFDRLSYTTGDTIKSTKLTTLQDKIKVTHKPLEYQVRIETDFPAADALTAEIINMIGVSCQKTNFRVNATIDYNLNPGIYFVVVYSNKQRIFTSKILVSR
jgi:hypothetical protein